MSIVLNTEPDLYVAVKAFVAKYAFPDISVPIIRQGWTNRSALPANSQSYAVLSIVSVQRHGTNIIQDGYASGVFSTKHLEHVEASVQIDICAADDSARRRVAALETISLSMEGCSFFDSYGLAPIGCEDVRDLTFIGGEQQYVRRYTTTLHLEYWTGLTVTDDFFATASINHIYPYL